jgi:hypothetical protein
VRFYNSKVPNTGRLGCGTYFSLIWMKLWVNWWTHINSRLASLAPSHKFGFFKKLAQLAKPYFFSCLQTKWVEQTKKNQQVATKGKSWTLGHSQSMLMILCHLERNLMTLMMETMSLKHWTFEEISSSFKMFNEKW